jgi:hypothetical protein
MYKAVGAVLCAVGIVLACALPASAAVSANPVAGTWGTLADATTNGTVRAVLHVGNYTYVGGIFTQAVAPDGVTTMPFSNLMRLDAGGAPDPTWTPNPNKAVLALASDGTSVFVGGLFTVIGGKHVVHLAKLDMAGAVRPFATANGEVRSIATFGSGASEVVYVGGGFTTIAHQPQAYLGAVTSTGASVGTFRPKLNGPVYGSQPFSGGSLLTAGLFNTVNGVSTGTAAIIRPNGTLGPSLKVKQSQKMLAVSTNGSVGVLGVAGGSKGGGNAATAFDNLGNRLWSAGCDGDVQAVTPAGSQWVIGGHFGKCNGTAITKLAAVNGDGTLDKTWNPHVKGTNVHGVWALDASATLLYAGGDFNSVAGGSFQHFAQWQLLP